MIKPTVAKQAIAVHNLKEFEIPTTSDNVSYVRLRVSVSLGTKRFRPWLFSVAKQPKQL